MTLGSSCNFNKNSSGLSITAQGTQEKKWACRKPGHDECLQRIVTVGKLSFVNADTIAFTFQSRTFSRNSIR